MKCVCVCVSAGLCAYGGSEVLLGHPVWQRNYLSYLPLMSVPQPSVIFVCELLGLLVVCWWTTCLCSTSFPNIFKNEARCEFLYRQKPNIYLHMSPPLLLRLPGNAKKCFLKIFMSACRIMTFVFCSCVFTVTLSTIKSYDQLCVLVTRLASWFCGLLKAGSPSSQRTDSF